MLQNNLDILYSNDILDENSNDSYPFNSEDFLRNKIEYIGKTYSFTKDTSDNKITEDNIYKAFEDNLEIEKGIKLTENDENKKIININLSDNKQNINIKKKRGRKLGEKAKRKYKRKTHTRNDDDNILSKLQVHFMKFILNISNDAKRQVLKEAKKLYFKDIDYKIKKNISYTFFEKIKYYKIKDILQMPISSKYRNYKENYNQKVYNLNVNKSVWLQEFYEMDYMTLFKKYYNNAEKLNKLNFKGKDIILSKNTKSLKDLIESNLDLKEKIIKVCSDYYFIESKCPDNICSNNLNNYFRVVKVQK